MSSLDGAPVFSISLDLHGASPCLDAPFFHEVALNPTNNLGAQPLNVDTGIITSCSFAFCIGCSADIDDVNESIGMSQIVQEAVSETLALMRTRHQTSYVEQLDGYRAGSIITHAIIWFTSFRKRLVANVGDSWSRACAWNLKISYSSVGVDGSKTEVISGMRQTNRMQEVGIREVA